MEKKNQPIHTDLEVVPNEYRGRDYTIEISIPENLQQFKKDLTAMHNLKTI